MSDNKASNENSETGLELDKVDEDYVRCTRDLIKLHLKWAEQGMCDKGSSIALLRSAAGPWPLAGASKAQFLNACGVAFDEMEQQLKTHSISSN